MCEILFRGKLKTDNGEKKKGDWVTGDYVRLKDGKHTIHCIYGKGEVDADTVGQFTGLTDKNAKKIFAGDIVKFAKHIYQIIFECGSFALFDVNGEMITKIGGMNDHCYSLMNLYLECCWEDDCAYDIEVIGNIHNNPEWLKGGVNNEM